MTASAEIAKLIRRETGIVVPASREAALLAAVTRAAPGLDPAGFLRAATGAKRDRSLVSRLVDEVTVQETAFLRDRRQLEEIAWATLLRAAVTDGSGTIRVWSAACATGEEAYTLALLAAEAFAPASPPVDVLGTDISGAALEAAAAGRYGERAVRSLTKDLRLRYLDQQTDGSYLVGARLRRLVRFRRHNLVRDPLPPSGESGFDVIVCRNVLIYFEPSAVEQVIGALERSLRPGGTLLLGAADALVRTASGPVAPRPPAPASGELPRSQSSPSLSREQLLAAALDAADKGDRDTALAHVTSLLEQNSLDADAHFVAGLVALEAGRAAQAVTALRRALFADPRFGLAAFTLGRAYDALGDARAARRSYEVALRTLDPGDSRHGQMLQQVDVGDIAAACSARLAGRQ
jgi:chemotaxis protein methyltransferase CheR